MKKFKVIVHPDAELDMNSAFEWGCRHWGEEKARVWARELRQTLKNRLTLMPLSWALAPESEELGISVRQLIVGRYKVLFIIEKKTVTILYVRGAYTPQLY